MASPAGAGHREPTVLLLASGRGERFNAAGGSGSKLQALLAGRPVLDHTLAAVQASGLPWHLERAAHAGMGDSIAAAVRATATARGWLILPGDLPLVAPATLRAVAAALAQGSSCAWPEHQGRRGHPVGFAAHHRDALMQLQGDRGAARCIPSQGGTPLPVDDPGCLYDIDTPADLLAAQALLAARTVS